MNVNTDFNYDPHHYTVIFNKFSVNLDLFAEYKFSLH